MFLGWGTRVGWLTVGIKPSFVADANGVSVVTAGMSTNHLIRATLVQLINSEKNGNRRNFFGIIVVISEKIHTFAPN